MEPSIKDSNPAGVRRGALGRIHPASVARDPSSAPITLVETILSATGDYHNQDSRQYLSFGQCWANTMPKKQDRR